MKTIFAALALVIAGIGTASAESGTRIQCFFSTSYDYNCDSPTEGRRNAEGISVTLPEPEPEPCDPKEKSAQSGETSTTNDNGDRGAQTANNN